MPDGEEKRGICDQLMDFWLERQAEWEVSSNQRGESAIGYRRSLGRGLRAGSLAVHWRRRSDIAAPWGEGFARFLWRFIGIGDRISPLLGERASRGFFGGSEIPRSGWLGEKYFRGDGIDAGAGCSLV